MILIIKIFAQILTFKSNLEYYRVVYELNACCLFIFDTNLCKNLNQEKTKRGIRLI